MKNFYMVKWGADFNDNYNYGTDIRFVALDYVHFSSPLMPSGTPIKTWYSRTEYHVSRKSPMLPLLENGKSYDIQVNAEFDNKEAVQVEIEFFDINNDVINKIYFQNLNGQFTYPDNAMSYKVQLVNKKHQYMLFKYLTISDEGLADDCKIDFIEKLNIIQIKKNEYMEQTKNEIVVLKNAKYSTSLTLNDHTNYFFFLGNTEESLLLPAAVYVYEQVLHSSHQVLVDILRGPCFNSLPQAYMELPAALNILIPTSRLPNISEKPSERIDQLKEKNRNNTLAYRVLEQAVENRKSSYLVKKILDTESKNETRSETN
ncbi:accessory Sec system protein Asp3 [Enterococcus sp. AZ072]|uniref:accessory Sec system protein Asp3 n=1 Tax=unclassified Enterococcus TaxID=2608891 RepID=UPI003D28FB9C